MSLKDRLHNFNEGETYPFLIKNTVKLDDDSYYILSYTDKKFMLNAHLYADYGFKIGDSIICKIDKINCSGKIFLEPENPLYKDKSSLSVLLKENQTHKNIFGQLVYKAIVVDEFDKEHSIPNCIIPDNVMNTHFYLKIRRIRKGKVIFEVPNNFYPKHTINTRKSYIFEIGDTVSIGKRKFIYMMDPFDKIHGIDLNNYSKYNFEKGKSMECMVIKFNSEEFFVLEPKHPKYELDFEYLFDYKVIDRNDELCLLEIHDCFFNKIEYLVSAAQLQDSDQDNKIKLTIKDIRKGVPVF